MGEKITKENYKSQIKPFQPKPSLLKNGSKAFIIGGFICVIGQGLQNLYSNFLNFSVESAGNLTLITLILISVLLTGFGVFDKISQFAGAGSIVPITGFANSLASAALEHKSEGLVLGLANNMFKVTGAVIVYGVVAATIVGFIRYLVQILFT